jgi:hypothetical protein
MDERLPMTRSNPNRPRLVLASFALLLASLVAGAASAEMYKYVDSKGQLHFTQDIGQVPLEYRNQVEKKVLRKKISVTGEGDFENPDARVRAMKQRSRQLQRSTRHSRPKPVSPPAARKNRLEGAAEPKKYHRECWWEGGNKRCRKWLTSGWRAWDAANGGNNGKAVTRRRIGDD